MQTGIAAQTPVQAQTRTRSGLCRNVGKVLEVILVYNPERVQGYTLGFLAILARAVGVST